ncbi:substrate-binding periplasmic protein [Pseudomonas sp. ES4]|uniref:substrate-binding periplasmic protein n=1 Tax=Pseudomonas sp. ES4 TaxID=3424777 RepID=UPI003D33EA4F
MKRVAKYFIGYDSENKPFTFVRGGVGCGLELDYLRAVCEVAELDCQFVPIKWSELFRALDAGEVHAIFSSISRTYKRSLSYNFTAPYFDSPEAIIYKGRLNSFSAARSMGVLSGSNHHAYAQSEFHTLKLFEFSDLNALAEGFQDESIDSLLVGVDVANLLINNFPALELKLHDELIVAPEYFGEGSCVVVNKLEGALLESLNLGMSKLGCLRL